MKRVGVMTFLHNDNYGSTLQAWALQKAISQLGYEAEHIDYAPSSLEKLRNLVGSGNSPKLVLEGLRKRAVKAGNAGARRKSAAFPVFYRTHMRLSPVCQDRAALKRQSQRYDVLLSGSDQIWSPVWLNPAYFLHFTSKPKVAYAPSLGVSQLPNEKKARRMAGLIRSYSAVSLREKEGAQALAPLLKRDLPVMPDPVFLQTREAWQALAQRPGRKHPFLLCYFIGDSPDYWQRAADYAAQTGLRVKVIPVTENAYRQPYELLDGLSPAQWLGYLEEAACICTDSFHGASFASIFQRPFHVFRRYREDNPESKNSRIDNLLRELALDGQEEDIPWETVTVRLAAMRQRGLDWLRQALATASAGQVPPAGAKQDEASPL